MAIWARHDDVIKWKHFPCHWPFLRGIHRSPVNSPHKGQWRGAFMFSLIWRHCNWNQAKGTNISKGFGMFSHLVLPTREHNSDVIMSAMASQITGVSIIYWTVYSGADQKIQSSASLAFVRDRWIPGTKDQWRGKWFHLMMSSWKVYFDGEARSSSVQQNACKCFGIYEMHRYPNVCIECLGFCI